MANEETGTAGRRAADRDALGDAMSELRDEHDPAHEEPTDRYWLRVGLGLGLRQPGRAQLLLERLEGAVGQPAAARSDETPPDGPTHDAEPGDDGDVPLRSLLLARSAILPVTAEGGTDPEALFGWAARLTRDEVLWMGRVVTDMLGEGASPDLTRGFGITWRADATLPEHDFDELFHAFTELEVTVCGVLAGYDLRAVPQSPRPSLLGGLLRSLLPPSDTRVSEAGAILDRTGETGRHALVALWNAWAAMRYRANVPPPLFAQLTRPWTTVVGRLPEA